VPITFTVTFDFSVKEAIENPVSVDDPIPTEWIDWVYAHGKSMPKLAVDRDGIPIVLWLPQFLGDAGHVSLVTTAAILANSFVQQHLQKVLMEFGGAMELTLSMGGGADSCGRNIKSAYRRVKGEIAGCINIALWHALAHTVRLLIEIRRFILIAIQGTKAILSKPQLGTCVAYSSCAKLVDEISMLSARLNEALKQLDPDAYASHVELSNKIKKDYPHARARASIDPILFQGRSVIFNRQTPNHIDRKDPKLGWNPLTTAGNYTGGHMRIRRLKLRMWYGAGSCIFVRGAILPHEVEEFEGGQCISIAHFCHESLWKEVGVKLRSSGLEC
jgi:hypothetical protein